MKTILAMIMVALFATALTGCWYSSRPESTPGCQRTTYGVAIASTSSENCSPAPQAGATPSTTIPPGPPPLPSAGTL